MREELEKLIAEATPGDLSTAELSREEVIECPVCGGDGEVDAVDYCNFDHKALGVQFYGIGNEFGAHEKLWSYFMNNAPALLAALSERDALKAENERKDSALREAETALRDYACHGGPEAPCLRAKHECRFMECGDAAGNALTSVLAALEPRP